MGEHVAESPVDTDRLGAWVRAHLDEPRHVARERDYRVTHRCPLPGSGVMPCCGKTPFEVPPTDRMAIAGGVTCRGSESSDLGSER